MENVIIRDMKKEDIPEVVDIQINGWKAAYKGIIDDEYLNTFDRNKRIRKIEQSYIKYDFIVAEWQGKIVGFANYINGSDFTPETPDADCELAAIYAEPTLKRRGIGTKLFKCAERELAHQNKHKMVLWCLEDNEPSKQFYEKMGGQTISERLIRIGNRDYTEVCFSYDIN